MDDLLRCLDPAYGPKARQNAQPVRRDDEYEDGQRQRQNFLPFSGPAMLVARSEKNSMTASKRFWSPVGTSVIRRGRQVGEHRQHDESEEGGDHGVGELEAGEELVREYGLRGQLDVSDRGGQESAAELVAERAPSRLTAKRTTTAAMMARALGLLKSLDTIPPGRRRGRRCPIARHEHPEHPDNCQCDPQTQPDDRKNGAKV